MTHESLSLGALETIDGEDAFLQQLATVLLCSAPRGGLTLLNGHALERFGGWDRLGCALREVGEELERDLLEFQCGDGQPHALSQQLTGEFISSAMDLDTDLRVAPPDWQSDAYDEFLADDLSPSLSPFGSGSIPALARLLASENHMSGVLPVLLVAPASARPYASILHRQQLVGDLTARASAVAVTHEWLAADLAAFAGERPYASTIVACDDRQPEWAALHAQAQLILPARQREP